MPVSAADPSSRFRCILKHATLLAGVSALALTAMSPRVQAHDILRGNSMASPVADVTAQQAAAMQHAQKAARRTRNALSHATRAIEAMRAAQQSARDLALSRRSTVPNGLKAGGLVVAEGAEPGSALWLGAEAPTQRTQDGRTEVTVEQTEKKAVLTWESFNVGRETDLHFDQRAGGEEASHWIALNRVRDPDAAPSRVLGSIKAEGQVYVVNRNGIIFGGSSQVNTSGLVASALSYRDEQFLLDMPVPDGQIRKGQEGESGIAEAIAIDAHSDVYMPEFGESVPDSGTSGFVPDYVPGDVVVDAGAEINVTDGGRLLMFGRQVRNSGMLSAVDGQVILAAGEQVSIIGDEVVEGRLTDLHERGHLEVMAGAAPRAASPWPYEDEYPYMQQRAEELGFKVVNDGVITSQRGDITLQGHVVEQAGILQATTALNNRAGSIHLRATAGGWYLTTSERDRWQVAGGSDVVVRDGALNLVMPDQDDTVLELSQLETRYTPSRIQMAGENIILEESFSWAPGGDVDLFAVTDWPDEPLLSPGKFMRESSDGWDGRIYLGDGAVVSVAGLVDVSAPMSRNNVEVELRVNELADAPLQRDGFLYGQTGIWVDRRATGLHEDGPMAGIQWFDEDGRWYGTPLANLSGWLNNAEISVRELAAQGGTVDLFSTGDIITRDGSMIDVAGGSIKYEAGKLRTTKLLGADGFVYDIGQADPTKEYVAIVDGYSQTSDRWQVTETWASPLIGNARYDPGYTEGQSGGTATMHALDAFVLDGNVVGGAIHGERQRGEFIDAGSLRIGGETQSQESFSLGNLRISGDPYRLPEDFAFDSALPEEVQFEVVVSEAEEGEDEEVRDVVVTHLSDDFISESGLGEIIFYVADPAVNDVDSMNIAEDAVLTMDPGGSLYFGYPDPQQTLAGDIRIPGGLVRFRGKVRVTETAEVDLSGQWVNDVVDGLDTSLSRFAIHGGSFSADLPGSTIEGGAVIDVSGGGWYRRDRTVEAGNAGGISLRLSEATDLTTLDLRGYALGRGGSLAIDARGIDLVLDEDAPAFADRPVPVETPDDGTPVGEETPAEEEVPAGDEAPADDDVPAIQALTLPRELFFDKGFASVDLHGRAVTIANTDLAPTARTYRLNDDYRDISSGARLADVGVLTTPLPRELARKGRLALVLRGHEGVSMAADAAIDMGLGGSIELTGPGRGGSVPITVDGRLRAAGGDISLGGSNVGTLTLGPTAMLDVAGESLTYTDERGLRRLAWGPDGGSIGLNATTVTMTETTVLDADGGAAVAYDALVPGGSLSGARSVAVSRAGDGGMIGVTATSGTIQGHISAAAGGAGAVGGGLSVGASSASGGGGSPMAALQYMLGEMGWSLGDLNGDGVQDWKDAIGYDFGSWGLPSGSFIITQEFVDAVSDASSGAPSGAVFVTDTVPTEGGVINPADYGLHQIT